MRTTALSPVRKLPEPGEAGELADGEGIAHPHLVAHFLHQLVEPQGVVRRRQPHKGRSGELRVKGRHVVPGVIERALVNLALGGVTPADGLRSYVQVNSDVHCPMRLLFEPMSNGSGRVYQRSPQEARAS